MGGRVGHQRTSELLRGTLDVLLLRALAGGRKHGYAIARWIEETTGEHLRIEEGSLYPALHRMERRGWVAAAWGRSENNRQAKYYALTRAGRAYLKAETRDWLEFAGRVRAALES
jgi:transcriptional regulator